MKMKGRFINVFLLMFVFYFVGCGGSPKEEISQHRVGEKILMDQIAFTVTAVSRHPQPSSEFSGPDSQEQLVVDIMVMNEGKHPTVFKLEEISLKDTNGKIYQGTPAGGPGNLLSTGRFLAMGDKIVGSLLYQINPSTKGLVLKYECKKLKKTCLIPLS